ncbi:hypothetical protein ACET9V_21385 [Aeromonas caviae]|uniref:hypothetical protein n=1 Tax=Aeromonas caviae TaxID=648 RepID=UPI0038CFA0F4
MASYQTAMQPRTLETYRGSWEDMVYSLPLEVDTNSAIKLELGYLGGMVQREFIFKCIFRPIMNTNSDST